MSNKGRRIGIYLTEQQAAALAVLRADFMASNDTEVFRRLLADAYTARRKPVGRPKKADEPETPVPIEEGGIDPDDIPTLPHYDDVFHKGELVSRNQMRAWRELRGMPPDPEL